MVLWIKILPLSHYIQTLWVRIRIILPCPSKSVRAQLVGRWRYVPTSALRWRRSTWGQKRSTIRGKVRKFKSRSLCLSTASLREQKWWVDGAISLHPSWGDTDHHKASLWSEDRRLGSSSLASATGSRCHYDLRMASSNPVHSAKSERALVGRWRCLPTTLLRCVEKKNKRIKVFF